MSLDLSPISTLPGVLQAAVGDDAGRMLQCAGREEPPTTAVLVLAHATLSAAAELGRRSGSGDCLELTQQHEGGCIYLHGLPKARVLLVRCQDSRSIPAVRLACHRMLAQAQAAPEVEPVVPTAPPSSIRFQDLSAAFHAEPSW